MLTSQGQLSCGAKILAKPAARRRAGPIAGPQVALDCLLKFNEALDPLFGGVPAGVDLFDRGLSRGDTPRLWIDPVAHIAMGRDKRTYRFLYDTRLGRRVLAESHEIAEIVRAVTDYVARRLVEREQALAEDSEFSARIDGREAQRQTRRRRRRGIVAFVLGFLACLLALLLAAAILASLS